MFCARGGTAGGGIGAGEGVSLWILFVSLMGGVLGKGDEAGGGEGGDVRRVGCWAEDIGYWTS